jgi:hypothetical protein
MTFLRTEEGGRTRPVYSGYRPQFYYQDQEGDAQHTYVGIEQVNPGDTVTAQLKFYSPQNHVGKITVGTEFQIREGQRPVATGHVTKILHLEDNAVNAGNRGDEMEANTTDMRIGTKAMPGILALIFALLPFGLFAILSHLH